MEESYGWITDLQRFSLYDGPGIRTTVFLKGCPLHCQWCHNPECIAPRPQLRYLAARCVGCQRCAGVCPQGVHSFSEQEHQLERDRCIQCGACVSVCPGEALLLTGRRQTVGEIMKPVLADRRYYETSGGGLTISGGEPTQQPEFLLALLREARAQGISTAVETCGACSEALLAQVAELTDVFLFDFKETDPQLPLLREARAQGISTAVETCGACSEALLAQVAELTDVFLFDFKETDPQLHKRWTGQDNRRILANLDWLQSHGARVILRCPLIPGCNLRQDHLEGILSLLARYPGLEGCELMAYHKLGIAKYKELGLNYALDAQEISPEQKDALLTWMNARAPLTIRWG